jgi:hypothetical protein
MTGAITMIHRAAELYVYKGGLKYVELNSYFFFKGEKRGKEKGKTQRRVNKSFCTTLKKL